MPTDPTCPEPGRVPRTRPPFRRLLAHLGAFLVPWIAAAADFPDTHTAISRSGQFVVSGPRTPQPTALSPSTPSDSFRELQAPTLAVSCERVKSEFLRLLQLPDLWRASGGQAGKILVGIDPLRSTNAPLTVQVTPFKPGWQFLIALPSRTTEDRLVRILVQALVLELANRSSPSRVAEAPLWLVEGLTQSVLRSAPKNLVLQPHSRTDASFLMSGRLDHVRDQLARHPPLSFHQLSQPDLDRMDERQWDLYAACAHLLVRELSHLPQGPHRLTDWIARLPDHWNWQSGFLEVYRPEFHSLLDVEKWWSLSLALFTGRNAAQAWSREFTLRKLDEALHPVGLLPGAGNQVSRVPLETIVRDWDFPRQSQVLRRFLQQIHAVRLHAPPDIAPLIFRYSDAVEEYLAARRQAGFAPASRGQPILSTRILVRDAVSRLRELDGERARLAQLPESPSPQHAPPP
ncbi:MAG: hypothetical protein KF833_10785 [Verrucomicrobiae bacterium]|nr:hypothetical protein [Verrucomicrobiae bacterium]